MCRGRDVLFPTVSSGDDPFAVSVPREIVSGAGRWMTRIGTDAATTKLELTCARTRPCIRQ